MTATGQRRSGSESVPFKQVDVFTSLSFKGNPVAVILDGDRLNSEKMQAIANWTNLSETTFVCAPKHPDADYRLRIFTPKSELPFAGHPTIGSAWAAIEHGLQPKTPGRLIQECGKGLVALRLEGQSIFLALPEPVFASPTDAELAAAAGALGLESSEILLASIVDVGAVWLTLQLSSAEKVIAIEPEMAKIAALGNTRQTGICVFGFYAAGNDSAVEVRAFAPAAGVPEDPVCGSGNGSVAAMIRRHALLAAPSYTASQGCRLGRDGRVEVEFAADGTIWLGGNAVTCIDGAIAL